jgi:hypothetical protein
LEVEKKALSFVGDGRRGTAPSLAAISTRTSRAAADTINNRGNIFFIFVGEPEVSVGG